MANHHHFVIPGIVGKAINLGSASRYPTAPADTPPRTYALEASLLRSREFSVHCTPATLPLIIADIERVRSTGDSGLRAACDMALAAIRSVSAADG